MQKVELQQLADHALEARIGLEVECSDAYLLRNRFYAFRRAEQKQGNTDYDCLVCQVLKTDILRFIKRVEERDGS